MLKVANSVISASRITGTLPVANGGTGVTTSTGTGNTVLSASPTFSGTAVFAALSGGTSGTGYSFSGSAPATSLTLDSSGNLGIGISSPSEKLHVQGNIRSANVGNTVYTQLGNDGVYATGTDLYLYAPASKFMAFYADGAEKMRIASSGIVTMSAYGAGTATFSAAGVISSVSDETWKRKDGVPANPDAMLQKLKPGYWYYNDEKKETFGSDRQLGFYAQNVNAAIGPEAAPAPTEITKLDKTGTQVGTGEFRPWGYYDRSVLAVTVMSLQKALKTIELLTARVAALEAK